MKIFILITIAIVIILLFSSCKGGYQKQGGQWVWVTYDESHGKRAHYIEGVDNASFKVSNQNKNFATDSHSAYFKGRKISHASTDGFRPLTDNAYGYAKDKYRVFFQTEVILRADPNTFTVLEFPYSRDKNDVYNGTLPMNMAKPEVEAFRVTNVDKMMAGSISTTLLSEFLKFNPEYQWIESMDIDVKWVITGRYGTGETNGKKFKGLKQTE